MLAVGHLYKWVKWWWRQHTDILASQVTLTLADRTNKSVSLKMQCWVKSSDTFSGFASKLLQTATCIPRPVSPKSPGVKFQGKQEQIAIQSRAWYSKRKMTVLWFSETHHWKEVKRTISIIYFDVTENLLVVQPCIKCHSALASLVQSTDYYPLLITEKKSWFQHLRHGKGCHLLDQVTQGLIQPGLEH